MLAVLAAALALSAPPQQDWSATLQGDARAFHDLVAANHPGPVDPLNPGFSALNDDGLRQAIDRAGTVTDYAGYRAAMRGYAARFDDSHLNYSEVDGPPVPRLWAGFLTAYDPSGRYVVATRSPDAPVHEGDVLVECDGQPADAIALSRLGRFTGRWLLQATRGRTAWRLFVEDGNPFIERPETCVFETAGGRAAVALTWRDFPADEFDRYAEPLASPQTPPIAARAFPDGTRWFSFSSFDGTPDGYVARRITPLIDSLRTDREALSGAPRIVLDLRGNGGGSSLWSRQIAQALWGRAAVEKATLSSDGVEWRASPGNVETFVGFRTKFAAAPPHIRTYVEQVIAGISSARAAGLPLWREPKGLLPDEPAPPSAAAVDDGPQLRTPVYVVTDWTCASACLDAVDLWRALGAIQVGQDTDADTLYIEARRDLLPSGLGQAVVPMKVYRGRPRGSNQPWRPVHPFPGDISDTPALEAWIAGLERP
ncbi:MAG: hypothetical protein EON86_04085 [Brevundimonas sp.]|nr:MAG: hypothetical protein EON86_04085 [Brevundimonas sp.]